MKILHLTSRADIGGGPEHLYQLVAHMPDHVDSYIACPQEPPYRQRYEALVGPDKVLCLPHRAFSRSAALALSKKIKAREIDLLHSHGKGAGLYARLLSMMTAKPCVHTFHGLHIGEYGAVTRSAYLNYERLAGLKTRMAICVSSGEREAITCVRILPRKKLRLIENGVILPDLRAQEPDDRKLRLITVNRFDHQKNPELLLNIVEDLKSRNHRNGFHLTVYGQGERFEACQKAIRDRNLGDVIRLAGSTFEPRAHFRNAHVFLSTSRWEGMPMAVLEAMSESLPVIVSDVVGNRDIVQHDISGLTFEADNSQAAAAAIERLYDVHLRTRLGQAARKQVETKYSVTRMAKITANLYSEVMNL